jgi:Predicted glycosyl hydrolase
MTLELVKDTLKLDQVIGEGQGQTLIDRDIIVPDIKPDIVRVLSVEGKVNITGKNVEQDRVSIEGMVNFSILYTTENEPQPIYSMNQGTNFSHYIDVSRAVPGMEPEVKCDIEHIDINKLNGRKLNVQCVLNMSAKVTESIPIDTVKDVAGMPDMQLLRDMVTIDETTGNETAQVVVRGTVEIPQDLPSAAEIVKCDALIHKKEEKVEDGRVVVSGCVLVPVLFSSKGDVVDIYKVVEDMVFTHTIEVPGTTPDMACRVEYNVDDVYAELKSNDDGENRQVDIEVAVGLKVRTVRRDEVPIIIDAYAPSLRVETEVRNISSNVSAGENASQMVIKESMQLPEGNPEIEKVYDMVCKPSITDLKLQDDKALVEGVVGCDIIYLARGEERAVHSFSDELPFKTSVALPGCKSYMKPEILAGIESMDCSMVTKDEVEVKIMVECKVSVFDKINKYFIVNMGESEGEIPVHKASITIYVVQPKDTLWMIAKRYYTTMDDIIKVNEIEEPDKIVPGMKLLIPKRL